MVPPARRAAGRSPTRKKPPSSTRTITPSPRPSAAVTARASLSPPSISVDEQTHNFFRTVLAGVARESFRDFRYFARTRQLSRVAARRRRPHRPAPRQAQGIPLAAGSITAPRISTHPSPPMSDPDPWRKHFWRNTATNYLSTIVRMATGIVLFRLLFQHLTREQFGYYSLLWSLFGYAILLDFGLGFSVQKIVAQKSTTGDIGAINRLVSTIFWSFSGLAAALLVLFAAIQPWFLVWIKVSPLEPAGIRRRLPRLLRRHGVQFSPRALPGDASRAAPARCRQLDPHRLPGSQSRPDGLGSFRPLVLPRRCPHQCHHHRRAQSRRLVSSPRRSFPASASIRAISMSRKSAASSRSRSSPISSPSRT